MTNELSLALFSEHVEESFAFAHPALAGLSLQLVAVTALPDHGGPRQPFSITFRGPQAPLLPQRTYRLEHGTLGALDVFIVPVGREAGGVGYEAVFN